MNKVFGYLYEVIFNMTAGAMIAFKSVGMFKANWVWTIIFAISFIYIGYWMKTDVAKKVGE